MDTKRKESKHLIEVKLSEAAYNMLGDLCNTYAMSENEIIEDVIRTDYYRCYSDIEKYKNLFH